MYSLLQLSVSTAAFILAAATAKSWSISPGIGKLTLTLVLYTFGNLIMLGLVRDFGMARAFSLSSIIQLVAVNLVAIVFFGERLPVLQSIGIALAIVSIALMTLTPAGK